MPSHLNCICEAPVSKSGHVPRFYVAAGLRGSPPRAGTWAPGTPRGPGWERLSTDTCSPALPTDRRLPRGFSVPAHDSPAWLEGSAVRRVWGIPHSRKNLESALFRSPQSPHTTRAGGGAASRGKGPCSAPSCSGQAWSLRPPRGSPGQWGWRHLCRHPYLEGTGDGNGTFLNSVITSQERLRPRGPSQARMWPLALQTAAQSTPSAGCHWRHRVPRRVGGALGFPALARTERWGWRVGDRGGWHSEVGGS